MHKAEGKVEKKERRTGRRPEANADHWGDSKIDLLSFSPFLTTRGRTQGACGLSAARLPSWKWPKSLYPQHQMRVHLITRLFTANLEPTQQEGEEY
jgi:hypothetical protein